MVFLGNASRIARMSSRNAFALFDQTTSKVQRIATQPQGKYATELQAMDAGIDVARGKIAELSRERRASQQLIEALPNGHGTDVLDRMPTSLKANIGSDVSALDKLVQRKIALNHDLAVAGTDPDEHLDGVLLLRESMRETDIFSLRARSSYWGSGFLTFEGAQISHFLSSNNKVCAEAAALLGQPVATAMVPTINKAGRMTADLAELHVIPHKVVGEANGFASANDAFSAATEHLGTSPGSTLVGIRDHGNRYHVLEARVNTGPREGTTKQWWKRQSTLVNRETTVVANHDSVQFVLRSDGSKVDANYGELTYRDWPAQHQMPLSDAEMVEAGMASVYRSKPKHIRKALAGLEPDLTRLQASILPELEKTVSEAERNIQEFKTSLKVMGAIRSVTRQVSELAAPISNADQLKGVRGPYDWAIDRIVSDKRALPWGSTGGSMPIESDFKLVRKANIDEAIMTAMLCPDNNVALAVMKDQMGRYYLANVAANFNDISARTVHNDVAAIVDNRQGHIWLRDSRNRFRSHKFDPVATDIKEIIEKAKRDKLI